MSEDEPIIGRFSKLDDDPASERSVWLGRLPDGGFGLHFVSKEGESTRLALTEEAMEALVRLYETELKKPAAKDGTSVYVATYKALTSDIAAGLMRGKWRGKWIVTDQPVEETP